MLQAKLYMNAKYIGSDNYAAVPLITKITGSYLLNGASKTHKDAPQLSRGDES
jgi:hypothetical protein